MMRIKRSIEQRKKKHLLKPNLKQESAEEQTMVQVISTKRMKYT